MRKLSKAAGICCENTVIDKNEKKHKIRKARREKITCELQND